MVAKITRVNLLINRTEKMRTLTTVVLLISAMIFNPALLFSNNGIIELDDSKKTKLEITVRTPDKLGFKTVFGKIESVAVKTAGVSLHDFQSQDVENHGMKVILNCQYYTVLLKCHMALNLLWK